MHLQRIHHPSQTTCSIPYQGLIRRALILRSSFADTRQRTHSFPYQGLACGAIRIPDAHRRSQHICPSLSLIPVSRIFANSILSWDAGLGCHVSVLRFNHSRYTARRSVCVWENPLSEFRLPLCCGHLCGLWAILVRRMDGRPGSSSASVSGSRFHGRRKTGACDLLSGHGGPCPGRQTDPYE